jgi:hypothetical protein
MGKSGHSADVVRGHLTGDRADRVLRFWADHGVLEGEAARARLEEVVCLLLDESDAIAGVNSAYEEALPPIGGRRFWVYRAYLPSDGGEDASAMLNAAFEALDAEYRADRSGPVGLCVVVSDPEEMRRRPEAIWPETELIYAGTMPDGRQLRLRYFDDATIGPGLPNSPTVAQSEAQDYSLGEGYRIVPLAETDAATPEDVLQLWAPDDAVPEQEAQRRVHEVLMVALDPNDRVAGVSTVYLERNPQLGMDLWYYRTYVANEHRMGHLAVRLLWATRDHLRERFESGEDTRAPGMIMEVESEFLRSYYNRAFWVISDFFFIGETERGAHVRVHYFPGVHAPRPQ